MDHRVLHPWNRQSRLTFERVIMVASMAIVFSALTGRTDAKMSRGIIQTSVEREQGDTLLLAQSKSGSSGMEYMGAARTKLLEGDEDGGRALKLRLLHRSALKSRMRKDGFLRSEEEILEVVKADEIRMAAFRKYLRSARKRENLEKNLLDTSDDETVSEIMSSSPSSSPATEGSAQVPSSSPSYSPSVEEFKGRVVSGASLPGNPGQYLVEFYVGTPAQKFLFIADTGSDLLWVPCSLCSRSCAAPSKGDAIFFPRKSSTFSPIPCSSRLCELVPPPAGGAVCHAGFPTSCAYQYLYSDLSQTTGIFALETVSFSSRSGKRVEATGMALGCGTNNSGPSVSKLAGVIGLGQGPISFVSQAGQLFGDKFSYCFRSFFELGGRGSALVFGEAIAETKLRGELQLTPLVQNSLSETFYYVGIEAVKVGGKKLAIPTSVWAIDKQGDGGTVIDSGTTLTFFLQPAYQIIVDSFISAIAYPPAPPTAGLSFCYNVSGITNPRFPSFSIIFQHNAVFRPPHPNYFLSPTPNLRCLAILATSQSPGRSTLGNLLQQNFFVQFDRSSNRLGFSRASCAAPKT